MPFNPATVTCGACHRIPPDGTRFPNLAGKHSKPATSSTATCDICHNGARFSVGKHTTNGSVNVSFLTPIYTPKTGLTPTVNTTAKTCANISCHGGQTTPSWYTGPININTPCTFCHTVGTAQYNGASSGEHDKHENGGNIACCTCHDTNSACREPFYPSCHVPWKARRPRRSERRRDTMGQAATRANEDCPVAIAVRHGSQCTSEKQCNILFKYAILCIFKHFRTL